MIRSRRISVLVQDDNWTLRYPVTDPALNWDKLSDLQKGDVLRIRDLGTLLVDDARVSKIDGRFKNEKTLEEVLLISCSFVVQYSSFIKRRERGIVK